MKIHVNVINRATGERTSRHEYDVELSPRTERTRHILRDAVVTNTIASVLSTEIIPHAHPSYFKYEVEIDGWMYQ